MNNDFSINNKDDKKRKRSVQDDENDLIKSILLPNDSFSYGSYIARGGFGVRYL
jgi:hypothetical protein